MVYECLKGEPPFSRGQIEFQILNNPPPPLVGRGDPTAPLIAGVMAGLAKKPEARPPTCTAVLEGDAAHEDAVRIGEKGETSRRNEFDTNELHGDGSSYTQADCIQLMADAKVAQRHLVRFFDNPAHKQELREIEDEFVRADAILAEKQWALAAEYYARIIERGKAIEEADARRVGEEKARREAEQRARRSAEDGKRQRAKEKVGKSCRVILQGALEIAGKFCRVALLVVTIVIVVAVVLNLLNLIVMSKGG